MKKGVLSLLISIFFFLLLAFISYYYSPFEDAGIKEYIEKYGVTEEGEFKTIISKSVKLGIAWEFINERNLFAWIISFGGGIIALFVSLHLGIDKFFFKEYYQKPDFTTAMRRGILFFIVILSLLLLHLLGAFVWYTALLSIILLVLIEWGFVSIKKSSKVSTQNNKQ